MIDRKLLEGYAKDVARLKLYQDPYKWVKYVFPWGEGELEGYDGPDEWQIDIMNTVKQYIIDGFGVEQAVTIALKTAVASGNGIGKSCLVSWLNLWAISTFEDTRGVITANTENQLRTKTWPELAKWHRLMLIKDMFVLSATAIYSADKAHEKTWRIDAIPWSENNPEAIAGLHNKGKRIIITFDEASAISDLIFEAIEGALTDENTEIFWFCFGNPTRNSGRFYDCFNRYKQSWVIKQIDSRTVKMTNKEQLKQWIEERGIDDDWVKVHILGQFPSTSLTQLISTEDAERGIKVHLRREQFEFSPIILTCDPAWEGDDDLVIAMRQGLYFRILRTLPKNDNDIEVAMIIANYETEYDADLVNIDAGYGTGIVSAGKTMGRQWNAIWFQGKPPDPSCLNMRIYMWKQIRDWLKEGGALPNDKELFDDLISPEVITREDGKIKLESKKDMKKRLGRSPNKGDALALSFAISIEGRKNYFRGLNSNKLHFANTCHNPIKNMFNRREERYNPLKNVR